jgi:hypothetical protein
VGDERTIYSSTIETWTHGAWGFPEAWHLELGPFLPSGFPYGYSGLCEKVQKTQLIRENPSKSD